MTCPHGCSVSSPPLPFPSTFSASGTLVLAAAQILRHIFGRLCSKPPYHGAFPWLLPATYIPITFFLHNTQKPGIGFSLTLLCISLLYSVYIILLYIVYSYFLTQKKSYALIIKKIYLDKYLPSKWLSYFVLMTSAPSLKRMDRVKLLLVSMMVRPVYIIMNVTVIYIIIGN